jgi:acetyl-CoA C-acetyltransferase/acetyl-CoA acyltransferase
MIDMEPIAVIAGKRTPFIKAFTEFNRVSAVDLGRHATLAAMAQAGIANSDVDELVFGNVSGPADAANIARVIALRTGIPHNRIAHTVNRNCASGMESVISAWHILAQGRAQLVVAGGTESMSQVPLLVRPEAAQIWLRLSRAKSMRERWMTMLSFRPKHFRPKPAIELGLTDPVCELNMGQTAEVLAKEFVISRAAQDEFALRSHQKAAAAQAECFLSGEIALYPIGEQTAIAQDNGPRPKQSLEQLARLKPIFDPHGSVTAGNSCPLTDGAVALVMVPKRDVARYDATPLGYVRAYAIAGCDPRKMGLGPVFATAKLLRATGLRMSDFDAIEINEAFAAQVLACQAAADSTSFANEHLGQSNALGDFPDEKLNVHGGAIALGHPVGATGTRLILTLLRTLRARGGGRGLATLCVGGGQGFAVVVETELE